MKKLIPLIVFIILVITALYVDSPFVEEPEALPVSVTVISAPQASAPADPEPPMQPVPEAAVELPAAPAEAAPVYTPAPIAEGSCTDTIRWRIDGDGTLTLSGTGAVPDFEKGAGNQPWAPYRQSVTALFVDAGISRVGDRALQSFTVLESAVFAGDSVVVGEWAFQNCYALTRVELPQNASLETGAFRSTPVEWEVCSRPSPAYTASSFRAALDQVVLTGNYRDDIISIALSQLGYHEGDSEADYGGGNPNGTGDYTEYGRCLDSVGSAWCSEFASWCIRQAGVPASAIANSRAANAASFTAGASANFYTWYDTSCAGSGYMPRKGDLILWAWDGAMYGTEENLSHTSILQEVVDLGNGNILLRTIDGNSNNQVQLREYEVSAAEGLLQGRSGRLCYVIALPY